jgi:hypothetical protein
MSYNIVRWVPRDRRWVVDFYSDRGDGSGFAEDLMVARRLTEAA